MLTLLNLKCSKYKSSFGIKNVTLKEGTQAHFPDSVTERGTKHLRELSQVSKDGDRAVMLYIVQRNDCEHFSVAKNIDPLYAKTLKESLKEGVEILAYECIVTEDEIKVYKPLPINLDF